MIEKLAQHYGNDSRIIGWQLDNEPAVQFDYNPKAELAFRDFLREKIAEFAIILELNGYSGCMEIG